MRLTPSDTGNDPLVTQPDQPPYGSAPPPPGNPAQPQPPYGSAPPYGSPYRAYPGQNAGYVASQDPSLAEWWRRLLAWLLDSIILGLVTSALWIPAVVRYARRIRNVVNAYPDINTPPARAALRHAEQGIAGHILLLGLAGIAISLAYYWLQYALWGRTIGKRALGTIVVTAASRAKIGGGAAGIRSVVFVIGPLIPLVGWIFWLVDNLWLLWDPQRQCLHDKAARTVVIKHSFAGRQPVAPA
jgi:uncharacterized RDD family membrane protein YckC